MTSQTTDKAPEIDVSHAAKEVTRGPTRRIGVVLGEMGQLNTAALKYLVLKLNTMQQEFEFEFLMGPKESLLISHTRNDKTAGMPLLEILLPEFADTMDKITARSRYGYDLCDSDPPIGYILITLAKLRSKYYVVTSKRVELLLLGEWESYMAPPSLLEALITLVLSGAVGLVSPKIATGSHLGTRGCLFDFTAALGDVRFKTLQGFICTECRGSLAADGLPTMADAISQVSDTSRWLGKVSDPSSPAGVVSNLGYDLFLTRGVAPSAWERFLALLRDEGTKEFVKIIYALLLAGIFYAIGMKK